LKIKQIGNGSGLNVVDTCSSFLVTDDKTLILIDCGFNVPKELFKLHSAGSVDLKKLKYVFITHKHGDHIGGLETLIYKMYFELGITLTVYFGERVLFEDYKALNQVYENNVIKYRDIVCTEYYGHDREVNLRDTNIKIIPFENVHKVCESFGFIIKARYKKVIISGDTKAFTELEEYSKDADIVFHDFSSWDCQSKNVHACKSDIRETYSKEFIERLTYYHNNLEFDSSWREV
jgi:ribonuclease BN (tRNA processing enzyme)